jgi:hypothetical protein
MVGRKLFTMTYIVECEKIRFRAHCLRPLHAVAGLAPQDEASPTHLAARKALLPRYLPDVIGNGYRSGFPDDRLRQDHQPTPIERQNERLLERPDDLQNRARPLRIGLHDRVAGCERSATPR